MITADQIQNRRGAPRKSEDEKSERISFSVKKTVYNSFMRNTKENHDLANRILEKAMIDYNEKCESIIEREKLSIIKHEQLRQIEQELSEFDQRIDQDRLLEEKCQHRNSDIAYQLELQRIVTEIRKKPKQLKMLPEKAKKANKTHIYPVKIIVKDVMDMLDPIKEEMPAPITRMSEPIRGTTL